MADRNRTTIIEEPATLRVGDTRAATLRQIIAGSVAVDFSGGVVANSNASAAATIQGLTTNHNVVVQAQDEPILTIAGAGCTANTLTLTANNPSGANVSGAAGALYNYFAWRTS